MNQHDYDESVPPEWDKDYVPIACPACTRLIKFWPKVVVGAVVHKCDRCQVMNLGNGFLHYTTFSVEDLE